MICILVMTLLINYTNLLIVLFHVLRLLVLPHFYCGFIQPCKTSVIHSLISLLLLVALLLPYL